MKAPRANGDEIVVRKYGNRRLYRTDRSCYVTLDELSDLVREGVDFNVVDAKSGADLTGMVLAQVILEEEKRTPGGVFPVPLLRQLIRLRTPAMLDFVTHHLPRLMAIFVDARERLADGLDMAVTGAASDGEAVVISQLAAVKAQLGQILSALKIEPVPATS